MKKLAIVSTHPIQYNAPLFALLSQRGRVQIKVFYTWGKRVMEDKYDPGFEKVISWDIPLLEGYDYMFVENIAKDPGSHHFKGIDNPGLIMSIKEWDADAVLIYGWSFKSHLNAIKYFHKKLTVFFRGDSTIIDYVNPLKKLFRTFFLKWVYSKVDKVLYVGTNNKNYYRSLGLKENQMIFVPHAIDNNRFLSNEINNSASDVLKEKTGVKPGSKVFLFAGKLEQKKNCKLLIDAFKTIINPDINLVLVGNGELEKELKLSANNNKNIFFLEFQNQQMMPAIYQVADVYVLPSKGPGETWGLSINEAMAASKAVLVSDACGAAIDLVQNGLNGFIFKSGDLVDLRQKMLQLLKPETDLKKMGHSSLEIIKDWNYENDCIAIESLLN